jgi:hypothetical protein
MPAATTSVNGYLTSTDWNTFNGKSNTNGTVTSVAALTIGTTGTDLSSTVATGTTTPVITLQVPTASATNRGALSSADWTTFNNKGSGTVTSVSATVPSFLSVAGSPITTSGTLALTYSGTALPAANGGTAQSTYTTGDILYASASNTLAKLTVGSTGQVLTVASGIPSWATASSGGFPSGTAMLFAQTSAPTGWTKSTTHDNKALRVVSGTASSGGSVAFTTAFASQAVSGTVGTSGATTLSTSQIPSHTHTNTFPTWGGCPGYNGWGRRSTPTPTAALTSDSTGGGGSHDHAGGTFTGTAINLAVQYVDVIIATKD